MTRWPFHGANDEGVVGCARGRARSPIPTMWRRFGTASALTCTHSAARRSRNRSDVDRERIAPSPPTQTGQAVLPHPAFQFVASDGLAQALDSWASEESHQP